MFVFDFNEENGEYEKFVEKFKPQKTTDDCYTPPLVYEVVKDWVAEKYNLSPNCFVRPFFPGGNYEEFEYSGKIVVDNPPFSIISKIIKWYVEKNIKFFLFSPSLTSIVACSDFCTGVSCGVTITYENGAKVATSFLTNLEPHEIRMKTEPELYRRIKEADEISKSEKTKKLKKLKYPESVITNAQLYQYNAAGVEFVIARKESSRITKLDCGQEIFGGGLLLSERLKAEHLKAEHLKAERLKAEYSKAEHLELSDREKSIIKSLSDS